MGPWAGAARGMDSKVDRLVEEAKRFADILQQASSSEVALWGKDDLERAFHWARYFSKTISRVAGKPSVISSIDLHVRPAGRRAGVRFGGEELSYTFLCNSSHYLMKALLENPTLPVELEEATLQSSADQGVQWRESCAAEASLVQSLTAVHFQLCQSKKGAGSTAQGLQSVSADCYTEHLQWLLSFDSCKFQEQLKALYQQTGGVEMILTALLQCPPKPVHTDMLQWLLTFVASELASHSVWEADPLLLAKVSHRYTDFFKAHLQHLIGGVESSMAAEQESGGDFLTLCSHFSALISCGPPVADVCLSAIANRSPAVNTYFDYCAASLLEDHPNKWIQLSLPLPIRP